MHTLTPPMGWNTWNTFGKDINEKLIRESADKIVELGLDKLGYEYVVIDDCWSKKVRDTDGRLVPDETKFPSGMKALADYIHSKGLKFGMYSCSGTLTCAGYPSSYGYEFIDAKTFAEWGVDFLKYDFCYKPEHEAGKRLYRRMGTALATCGRNILFSACSWGAENTWEWIRSTGAGMWRSTGDIVDKWQSIKALILQQLDKDEKYGTEGYMPFGGIGCFNDMDMLVVGMNGKGNVGLGGCTYEEYKTHFSAWCLLGSPLMLGSDIREMDEETKSIVMNKELIAVNQDRRGAQPYVANDYMFKKGWYQDLPVIARLMDNGDIAVGLFNLSDSERKTDFRGDQFGLDRSTRVRLFAKDLWSGEEFEIDNYTYLTVLQPHTCQVLRLKVVSE